MYGSYALIDEPLTDERQGSGIYKCFCKNYKEYPGVGYLHEGDKCYMFWSQSVGGYALGESVTVAITVVNTVIMMLCNWMIKKVGYHTISGEIASITVSIFIATFFNTAILLLLAD